MADESKLDKAHKLQIMLLCLYSRNSRIGSKGCRYLNKGCWPHLGLLWLGNGFSIFRIQ